MLFHSLDLEAAPTVGFPTEYALQPWRLREGSAKVTLMAVRTPDGEVSLSRKQFRLQLQALAGKRVATWNGLFDIAWMLAAGCKKEVEAIEWIDGMLLWKWYANSQKTERCPKWTLVAGAEEFCPFHEWLDEFVVLKNTEVRAGDQDDYWARRAELDVIATQEIVSIIWKKLDAKRQRAARIEAKCIVPFAQSWVRGIRVDSKKAAELEPIITDEMKALEHTLCTVTQPRLLKNGDVAIADKRAAYPDGWIPSKVLSSPKQLGVLLYDVWGLEVESVSEKTGNPSTDKAALIYLSDKDDRVLDVMRWRELNTQRTKFINGIARAVEYCGSDIIHPAPRIFSTYTGRVTYSSKIKNKYPIGVAIHQWPRNKAFRDLILAHEEHSLGEVDAAGQEVRLMAEFSQDANMLRVFNSEPPHDDIHSFTGAGIAGMHFDDFLKAKERGNQAVVGASGFRYCGKYINLSSQYRVGAKKSRIVARVQYALDEDIITIKQWQAVYFRSYPGVKAYWRDAINRAELRGYAETLAGRRFGIDQWDKADTRWSCESSAINTPIQGTGADMKELAMMMIAANVPEAEFSFDLHDGLYYSIPDEYDAVDTILKIKKIVDNLQYEAAWGWVPSMPIPWDAAVGKTWGKLEEVKE